MKSALGATASSLVLMIMAAPGLAAAQQQPTADTAATPAQTPAKTPAQSGDALQLDELVVTASAGDTSKFRSSISVTDVGSTAVVNFGARSESEILHLIPGIKAESSGGPGGNANITVRGLPIVAGGSKFVQLQEDGLPVVEYGDIAFGNNDIWQRYDYNIDRIEAVRGGSSSTLASNAPGAVINYLSKTGTVQGGQVGVTRGLNYDETRVDFDYGGPINDTLRFHVGGFYREGEGPRKVGYTAEQGGQIKANLTKTFNDDNGYVRVNVKLLDDKAPTYGATPMTATVGAHSVGSYGNVPGFDALTGTLLSKYNKSIMGIGPNNQPYEYNITDGVHPVSKAIGLEFHDKLNSHFTVDEKFRYDDQHGSFMFPTAGYQTIASVLAGYGAGATARFANGPLAGQTVTTANDPSGLLNDAGMLSAVIPDESHLGNDLSLSGRWTLPGDSEIKAKFGWYHSTQQINMWWNWTSYIQAATGDNPAMVNIYNAAGQVLTDNGITGYGSLYGGCCVRDYHLHYTTDAPYASVDFVHGDLNLDGSLRYDIQQAGGTYIGGRAASTITTHGVTLPVYYFDTDHPQPVNYSVDYVSYSFGANYVFNRQVSVFARVSRGGRANADRLIPGTTLPTTGALAPNGRNAAINMVDQQEAGVKYRNRFDWGDVSLFVTAFHATMSDYNYDLTTQVTTNESYRAEGLEIESAYSFGHFSLDASVTYTDAKITADRQNNPPFTGNVPRATPDWVYTITPSYSWGPARVGLVIVGQSASYTDQNNQLLGEGQVLVNAVASYEVFKNAKLTLNASNLFNAIAQDGRLDQTSAAGVIAPGIVSNRAEQGRTVSATLSYRF